MALLAFSLPPLRLPHDASAKLLSAALVGSIVLQPLRATRLNVLVLGAALAGAIGPLFALREGLPRYLLPALPFYYVLAAGALTSLLGHWTPLGWGICAVALVMGWRGPRSEGGDMAYVESVGTVHEATRYLEEAHRDDVVVVSCLSVTALRDPRMGYVQHPLRAFVVEEIGRRVGPRHVGAFLFRFLPGCFPAARGQNQRLDRELERLQARLGRRLVLEKAFEGPHDRVLVFRPD